MNVAKNFDLRELIHPDIYNHPAIGNRAADFLNSKLATTLQSLKDNLTREAGGITESITVNNWHINGAYRDSGLRVPDGGVGARLSAHRFGTAADCKFKKYTPIEVQEHILNNVDKYPHITRMEDARMTYSWLHIEVGMRQGDIRVFKP